MTPPDLAPAPQALPKPSAEPAAPRTPYRSKTLAAWLAIVAGALGLHRLYLHGSRDRLAWVHAPVTTIGVLGVERMSRLGQDDHLAWLLIPLLGLMLSQAMLCAIVYALMPDERWDARHNPGQPVRATRWGSVLAAVAALAVGGVILIGTIAFSVQKFFEWQLESPPASSAIRRLDLEIGSLRAATC